MTRAPPERIGTALERHSLRPRRWTSGGGRPARRAHEEASAAKRTAQELLDTGVEDFRRRNPGTLRFAWSI